MLRVILLPCMSLPLMYHRVTGLLETPWVQDPLLGLLPACCWAASPAWGMDNRCQYHFHGPSATIVWTAHAWRWLIPSCSFCFRRNKTGSHHCYSEIVIWLQRCPESTACWLCARRTLPCCDRSRTLAEIGTLSDHKFARRGLLWRSWPVHL